MHAIHARALPRLAIVLATLAGSAVPTFAQGDGPEPRSSERRAAATTEIAGRPISYPQYPSISPDGSIIVFSYAGDLWSVPADGGICERLTVHPSDEERSAWSPDGKTLAFDSERDGPANIYLMQVNRAGSSIAPGEISRVTKSDRGQALSGFSADGKYVYFSSNHEPAMFRGTRMYRAAIAAPADGGARMERLADVFGSAPRAAGDGILYSRGRFDTTRPRYVGSSTADIYRLETATGSFTRLTSDEHQDGDAFQCADGSVVFISARSGQNNVWRLKPGASDSDKTQLEQLTDFKPTGVATIGHGVRDFSVNPSGTRAVFCVWDTMYTLDLTKARPEPRPVELRAGGDFSFLDFDRTNIGRQVSEAALSPDGKTLAVISRGEIFIRSTEKDRPTRRVNGTVPNGAARARDLAWSPDGRVLYFTSDVTGVGGIYAATVSLAREDLGLGDQPERVPEAKPAEPKPEEPAPTKPEPAPEPKPEPGKSDPTADAPADAKPQPATEDKKDAPAAEPAKESKKPAEKKPDHAKRWAESITFKVEPVLVDDTEHRSPLPSPDGKRMLIVSGLGDLDLIDLDGHTKIAKRRTLVKSWNDPNPQWAADSRHVIYEVEDVYYNADIWLLDALADEGSDAAKPINLTRHPDMDTSPRLSADGKMLYFLSDRDASSNGEDEVFAISLDRKLDGLRPYELADYFKEAAENAKKRKPLGAESAAPSRRPGAAAAADDKAEAKPEAKAEDGEKKEEKKSAAPSPENPLKFDADDAYLRVRKVVSGVNAGNLEITPGGERVIYSASQDGSTALYSVDHAGRDRKTVTSGGASNVRCNLAGDKVLYISGGGGFGGRGGPPAEGAAAAPSGREAAIGRPSGGEAERLPIDAPVVIDIAQQQKQKFAEAARVMGARFYHPTLKNLDWPALTKRYMDLAVKTRTDTEFNRVFANMLGELDGSHMGISGGRSTSGSGQSIGYLGIDARPVAGGYQITRIIPNSPADATSTKLEADETIVAINGKPICDQGDAEPTTDLGACMAGTSGQETLLEVARPNGSRRYVLITPVSSATDSSLRYRDEVKRRAEAVDKLSGGKLGYLHIRSMDMASVRDYERDLFAAAHGKDGLIIDVRDNGGGSTADILLASLTAPRHAYTAARGVNLEDLPKDAYPRDRRLIYAYNRPITVLINYNSYSNAEIFAHAIKTTGRGKIVGTPTFGAVISTGSASLIDGTSIRTPFRGWYLPDGRDMENNGCEPDIRVDITPEDETAGKDPQLEKAVEELLTRAKPF